MHWLFMFSCIKAFRSPTWYLSLLKLGIMILQLLLGCMIWSRQGLLKETRYGFLFLLKSQLEFLFLVIDLMLHYCLFSFIHIYRYTYLCSRSISLDQPISLLSIMVLFISAVEGDGIGTSARVGSWAFRWYDWKHCGQGS